MDGKTEVRVTLKNPEGGEVTVSITQPTPFPDAVTLAADIVDKIENEVFG